MGWLTAIRGTGPTFLAHDSLAELVLLQVHEERAVVLLDQALLLQLLERGRHHLRRHPALARVLVEADVQARVDLLVRLNRQIAETLP